MTANTAHKLTPEVRTVLEASRVHGRALTLPHQLDRKLYVQVNKAIELMGGTWSRKDKCHTFEDDAEAVVADAITQGSVADLKTLYQFYETPPDIAQRLIGHAKMLHFDTPDAIAGLRVLEPSAGRGAIVRELRAVGCEPFVYELWDRNLDVLRELGARIVGGDFLLHSDLNAGRFDRIVANPPFTRGQDIEHVTAMWMCLKPGGTLVSVMSPSWRFRDAARFKAFRAWAERVGAAWHELPQGSFAASGTSVNAGFIVATKPGCP